MNTLYVVNETFTSNYMTGVQLLNNDYIYNLVVTTLVLAIVTGLMCAIFNILLWVLVLMVDSLLNPLRASSRFFETLRSKTPNRKDDIPTVDISFKSHMQANGREAKYIYDKNQLSCTRLKRLYPLRTAELKLINVDGTVR